VAPLARLSVVVPEPPPRPAPSDQKSESQDMAPMVSVGVPAHGDDSAVLEHIRRALDEPLPRPGSPDQKSSVTAPIRASFSLDWSRNSR
jgi:hypothetical protein